MNAHDRIDQALDAALEMTFPASDPIAVYAPEERASVPEERAPAREKRSTR